MGDLVVIIPGIGGSVLERNGKVLWNPTLPWCAKALVTGGEALQPRMKEHP